MKMKNLFFMNKKGYSYSLIKVSCLYFSTLMYDYFMY